MLINTLHETQKLFETNKFGDDRDDLINEMIDDGSKFVRAEISKNLPKLGYVTKKDDLPHFRIYTQDYLYAGYIKDIDDNRLVVWYRCKLVST